MTNWNFCNPYLNVSDKLLKTCHTTLFDRLHPSLPFNYSVQETFSTFFSDQIFLNRYLLTFLLAEMSLVYRFVPSFYCLKVASLFEN